MSDAEDRRPLLQRVWSKRQEESRKTSIGLLGACVATLVMASAVRPAMTLHSLIDDREQENQVLATQLLAEQRHRHTSVIHLINKSAELDVRTLSFFNYCERSRQTVSELDDLRAVWEQGLEIEDITRPPVIENSVRTVRMEILAGIEQIDIWIEQLENECSSESTFFDYPNERSALAALIVRAPDVFTDLDERDRQVVVDAVNAIGNVTKALSTKYDPAEGVASASLTFLGLTLNILQLAAFLLLALLGTSVCRAVLCGELKYLCEHMEPKPEPDIGGVDALALLGHPAARQLSNLLDLISAMSGGFVVTLLVFSLVHGDEAGLTTTSITSELNFDMMVFTVIWFFALHRLPLVLAEMAAGRFYNDQDKCSPDESSTTIDEVKSQAPDPSVKPRVMEIWARFFGRHSTKVSNTPTEKKRQTRKRQKSKT